MPLKTVLYITHVQQTTILTEHPNSFKYYILAYKSGNCMSRCKSKQSPCVRREFYVLKFKAMPMQHVTHFLTITITFSLSFVRCFYVTFTFKDWGIKHGTMCPGLGSISSCYEVMPIARCFMFNNKINDFESFRLNMEFELTNKIYCNL